MKEIIQIITKRKNKNNDFMGQLGGWKAYKTIVAEEFDIRKIPHDLKCEIVKVEIGGKDFVRLEYGGNNC